VEQDAITEVIYWLFSLISSKFSFAIHARILKIYLISRSWYWWKHSEFRGARVYLFLQLKWKSHFPCADTWFVANIMGVKRTQGKNKTCWWRANKSSSIQETFHRYYWTLWKMFLNQSNGWRQIRREAANINVQGPLWHGSWAAFTSHLWYVWHQSELQRRKIWKYKSLYSQTNLTLENILIFHSWLAEYINWYAINQMIYSQRNRTFLIWFWIFILLRCGQDKLQIIFRQDEYLLIKTRTKSLADYPQRIVQSHIWLAFWVGCTWYDGKC